MLYILGFLVLGLIIFFQSREIEKTQKETFEKVSQQNSVANQRLLINRMHMFSIQNEEHIKLLELRNSIRELADFGHKDFRLDFAFTLSAISFFLGFYFYGHNIEEKIEKKKFKEEDLFFFMEFLPSWISSVILAEFALSDYDVLSDKSIKNATSGLSLISRYGLSGRIDQFELKKALSCLQEIRSDALEEVLKEGKSLGQKMIEASKQDSQTSFDDIVITLLQEELPYVSKSSDTHTNVE